MADARSVARWLRAYADRIDPHGAYRPMGEGIDLDRYRCSDWVTCHRSEGHAATVSTDDPNAEATVGALVRAIVRHEAEHHHTNSEADHG